MRMEYENEKVFFIQKVINIHRWPATSGGMFLIHSPYLTYFS